MKWLLGSAAAVLVLAFVYVLLEDEAPVVQPFPQELADEPDILIAGARVSYFDASGHLTYELSADSGRYTEAEAVAQFDDLQLRFEDEQQGVWHASAKNAFVNELSEGVHIDLRGEVELWTDPKTTDKFILRTEGLWVFPETQWVESTAPIVVLTPTSKIRADKIEGDLSTRYLHFSSRDRQVELVYTPDA